jgi:hypothetical protein
LLAPLITAAGGDKYSLLAADKLVNVGLQQSGRLLVFSAAAVREVAASVRILPD